MQRVNHPVRPGQGSVASCASAPFERLIASEPGLGEALGAEEKEALEALEAEEKEVLGAEEREESVLLLVGDRARPAFRPAPELTVEAGSYRTVEEGIMRSFSRRAIRAVRPLTQCSRQEELWVAGFDEQCRAVDLRRLVPGPQGQAYATVSLIVGWAEAVGARAIVLLQNQPGRRRGGKAVELFSTVKLAITADLCGIAFVDHVVIHGGGAPTRLREWNLLAGVETLATDLQEGMEEIASVHRGFGLGRAPEPSAALR
jgi:DNA repair protein RadC